MSEAINAVCVDMPDEARKKQAKLAGEKAAQGKKLKKEDVEYLVSIIKGLGIDCVASKTAKLITHF